LKGAALPAVRKEPVAIQLPVRVPEREDEPRSFLRGAALKALLFAGIAGVLLATERQEVGRVVRKLVDMPKDAATQTGMANVVSLVQADFVDAPLPKPKDFTAYLKSRAVANVDKAAVDGWGTEYRLDESPSAVRSAGPDRAFDTPDDIVMELAAKK
jgi:hypothetical protein